MSDIKDWSTTAASNNANPPDGFPEAMAPSDVNNSAREIMAAVRTYYDEPEWRDWGHTVAYASATSFTTSAGDGDTTSIYHTERRVRAVGSITGTIYGSISSSSHTTQTTVNVTWDSGSLSSESLTISVGAAVNTYSDAGTFASGTVIPFFQASAPTGWTQNTTHNDKGLRVVSGTGGGNGGTVSFSSMSHNHQWYDNVSNSSVQSYDSGGSNVSITSRNGVVTANAIMCTGAVSAEEALGSTSTTEYYTDNGSLSPLYIDVIVCSKD
jgi:hypothetical protein